MRKLPLKIIVFGATGMVGQGVLRESLRTPEVEQVLVVGRTSTGLQHPKLRELVQADLSDLSGVEQQLRGYDACFFCLGVSAAGMSEEAYRRITYDLTLGIAQKLSQANDGMTFIYVSGMGTDSTEKGRTMWARVKGETENALLKLPFRAAYMFRPGVILPSPGVSSKTAWYRLLYGVLRPLGPALLALFPRHVMTTEQISRAMLEVTRQSDAKRALEAPELVALSRGAADSSQRSTNKRAGG